MKTLTSKYVSLNDKELFYKMMLISTIMIGVCTTVKFQDTKLKYIQIANFDNDEFGNFDQVHIPNDEVVITKMISVLKPKFSHAKSSNVAKKIYRAFIKYKIEPQIIVAILDTESSFNHDLVSSSGDLSMAQVNVPIWNKEFTRMNLNLIEESKLKSDQSYSLEVMAQILQILKTRYSKKDRRWYARYHSHIKKHKGEYLSKLDARLKLLERSQLIALQ
ncbi:MAG: transglycosylase SLT domain-containing protein [Bacteriovorax sp.]|nr:transglycosylase SLT domain-containing protein [Bacteriovorax sp.]